MLKVKKNFISSLIVLCLIMTTMCTFYTSNSYASSIIYYFNIFIIFGFSSYGTKRIAQCRDDRKELNDLVKEVDELIKSKNKV